MESGGRKGRPNYPSEFKQRLALAACEPGVSVSKLAQMHGVNANMVFKWRRELRASQGATTALEAANLLPECPPKMSCSLTWGLEKKR